MKQIFKYLAIVYIILLINTLHSLFRMLNLLDNQLINLPKL
jgi:hypothetical protein